MMPEPVPTMTPPRAGVQPTTPLAALEQKVADLERRLAALEAIEDSLADTAPPPEPRPLVEPWQEVGA